MTNFIEEFRLLKNNYEKKEKGDNEANTYELLKKLICKYGYDSVCNEISFYNEKNESKNKELSFIISEVKKKVSVELLCSMLFYLDDSDILSQKNNLNFEQINDFCGFDEDSEFYVVNNSTESKKKDKAKKAYKALMIVFICLSAEE